MLCAGNVGDVIVKVQSQDDQERLWGFTQDSDKTGVISAVNYCFRDNYVIILENLDSAIKKQRPCPIYCHDEYESSHSQNVSL